MKEYQMTKVRRLTIVEILGRTIRPKRLSFETFMGHVELVPAFGGHVEEEVCTILLISRIQ